MCEPAKCSNTTMKRRAPSPVASASSSGLEKTETQQGKHRQSASAPMSRLAAGGGERGSLFISSHAEDKQRKYRAQRRQKILTLFLAVVIPLTFLVVLLFAAPAGGGGNFSFLRRQSATKSAAVDSTASILASAADPPPPVPVPVPTASDKTTLHKIGLFLGLRTESPTLYPTAMPTTATPTTATPTDTPSMTPTNSPTEVPTEVPTAAPTGIPTDAPTSSPLPLPTTAKTTFAKDDNYLLSLTPNETIIDPLNNTINSVTNASSDKNLSENGLPTFKNVASSDSIMLLTAKASPVCIMKMM